MASYTMINYLLGRDILSTLEYIMTSTMEKISILIDLNSQ